MSTVLVDSDVFSFLFKGHSFGALYEADLDGKTAALSFMTVAELDRWAIQSRWSEARKNWLRLYMERSPSLFMTGRFARSGLR
jgi:predicted nucleic acid-binding protein